MSYKEKPNMVMKQERVSSEKGVSSEKELDIRRFEARRNQTGEGVRCKKELKRNKHHTPSQIR